MQISATLLLGPSVKSKVIFMTYNNNNNINNSCLISDIRKKSPKKKELTFVTGWLQIHESKECSLLVSRSYLNNKWMRCVNVCSGFNFLSLDHLVPWFRSIKTWYWHHLYVFVEIVSALFSIWLNVGSPENCERRRLCLWSLLQFQGGDGC